MAKGKVCVFGSFVVDLTGRASHLPVKGETVIGSYFKMGPGGKGANQAVAAKRAGGDTVLATKIGEDAFGTIARDNFKKEGLDSEYIFTDRELSTGTALIMVDEDAANSILVVSGACGNITQNEVESCEGLLGESDYLLTQLEVNMDATEQVISMAHRLGVCVVLNTAPVQPVSDQLLSMVDIVTPNEVEASIISGVPITHISDCSKAAEYFLNKGVKQVVITCGEQGVYCNDGKREAVISILPVKAVDTTGAGDAFNGGFVTALAEGKDFFQAAVFGSVTAGIAVTKQGTAVAMPYRHEIDRYMELYGASLAPDFFKEV